MPANLIQTIAIALIPVLFAITVHEAAHGYAARMFGDRTAEMLGRLTLNPLKHIDPIGTVLVPLVMTMLGGFIFGWAKPVPVAARNLKNPKRDMAIVAAAGPASNIAMAIFWAIFLKIGTLAEFGYFFTQMARMGVIFNLLLAILNMIPVPPLDGSRVLNSFLPPTASMKYERIEPYGLFIILFLLVTKILYAIMLPPLVGAIRLLENLFGVSIFPGGS